MVRIVIAGAPPNDRGCILVYASLCSAAKTSAGWLIPVCWAQGVPGLAQERPSDRAQEVRSAGRLIELNHEFFAAWGIKGGRTSKDHAHECRPS